jgi:beta-galactosidase
LGKQKPDTNIISNHLNHPPFTFKIGAFEKGELVAKAFIGGKEVATYSVKTPETPVKIVIKVDESRRVPKAGCNDVVFVYAMVLDSNGTIVPVNGLKIDFKVEGDAKVMNQGEITTEAGIATVLVKIGNSKEKIKITASDSENRKGSIQFKPL